MRTLKGVPQCKDSPALVEVRSEESGGGFLSSTFNWLGVDFLFHADHLVGPGVAPGDDLPQKRCVGRLNLREFDQRRLMFAPYFDELLAKLRVLSG